MEPPFNAKDYPTGKLICERLDATEIDIEIIWNERERARVALRSAEERALRIQAAVRELGAVGGDK